MLVPRCDGAVWSCLALLLMLAGCGGGSGGGLAGVWVGRPDSSAARAARGSGDAGAEADTVKPTSADDSKPTKTDWEAYDVELRLDLGPAGGVRMTLNGVDPVEGTWRVVSSGAAGDTIEIESPGEDGASVRRRFEAVPTREAGVVTGLLFSEYGADPDLGAFYLERADAAP